MKVRPTLLFLVGFTVLLCGVIGCARDNVASTADSVVSPQSDTRVVFAEHGDGTTIFWSAQPEEPADRRQLASVRHDSEWGIRASLSPDGGRIAYTAMPPGASDPDGGAVLTVLDLDGKSSRRLATGVDLRVTPVWLGDDRVVVQRRGPIGAGVLVEVGANGDERALLAAEAGRRLFPIGVHPDGRLFVADSGGGETRLRSIDPKGAVHDLGVMTNGPARGFVLAPDGGALAFLALMQEGSEARYRAHLMDVGTKEVRPIRQDRTRDQDTGVVWAGDGFAVSAVDGGQGILLGASPGHDLARDAGFDAAASASPDGSWMAVRAFAGGSPDAPGSERLQLVSEDGRRTTVDAGGGVTLVGWTDG